MLAAALADKARLRLWHSGLCYARTVEGRVLKAVSGVIDCIGLGKNRAFLF
jgi:hypothetical protein